MSFERTVKRLKNPDEEIYLQHIEALEERDTCGDFPEGWVTVMDLYGLIQEKAIEEEGVHGKEETGKYIGFFSPKFKIPYAATPDYRIRHVIPGEPDRFYELTWIDRNLFLKGKRHHYEIGLELSRKWYRKS